MLAQPWMDRTPIPRKTPLQLAEDDVRHWSARLRELTTQLADCQRELADAMEREERERRKAK